MARLLGHRQTKGAATDKPILPPPRHISTLPGPAILDFLVRFKLVIQISSPEITSCSKATVQHSIINLHKADRRVGGGSCLLTFVILRLSRYNRRKPFAHEAIGTKLRVLQLFPSA